MLGTFTMPKSSDWLYIILLGIFATFAQIYMTKAYSFAKLELLEQFHIVILHFQ